MNLNEGNGELGKEWRLKNERQKAINTKWIITENVRWKGSMSDQLVARGIEDENKNMEKDTQRKEKKQVSAT